MFHRRALAAAVASGFGALICSLCLQAARGDWHNGWAVQDDAPGHLVSSLLIRQYVVEGLPALQSPMDFAYAFYHRFPKVGIGHWPPLFHTALAAWLIVVPSDPAWIFGFQALLAGVLATLTALIGSLVLGLKRAFAAGLAAVLTLPVAMSLNAVMADILCAVFVASGLLAFIYYWRSPRLGSSLAFGCCLAAALLTKPSGGCLAFVPPLCTLFQRRWRLLATPSFWLLFLPSFVFYAPWHVTFLPLMRIGWLPPLRLKSALWLIPSANILSVVRAIGWIGLPAVLWRLWRPRLQGSWIVISASLLAVFVFLSFVAPVRGLRHFTTAAPALAVLAAGGIREVSRTRRVWLEPALWTILFAALILPAFRSPNLVPASRLVDELLGTQATSVWLVAGSSRFEGDVLADAALRRSSGGLSVYRSSKLLFEESWGGSRSRPLVHSVDETRRMLDRCRIEVVILGDKSPRILTEAVAGGSASWRRRVMRTPFQPGVVFERIAPPLPGLGDPVIQKP